MGCCGSKEQVILIDDDQPKKAGGENEELAKKWLSERDSQAGDQRESDDESAKKEEKKKKKKEKVEMAEKEPPEEVEQEPDAPSEPDANEKEPVVEEDHVYGEGREVEKEDSVKNVEEEVVEQEEEDVNKDREEEEEVHEEEAGDQEEELPEDDSEAESAPKEDSEAEPSLKSQDESSPEKSSKPKPRTPIANRKRVTKAEDIEFLPSGEPVRRESLKEWAETTHHATTNISDRAQNFFADMQHKEELALEREMKIKEGRKTQMHTLSDDDKKVATMVTESNIVHKKSRGQEGLMEDYLQHTDPAKLQQLIDQGLIPDQSDSQESNLDLTGEGMEKEFNINNNAFLGRLARDKFEEKVLEICEFIKSHEHIQIVNMSNAQVDGFFILELMKMMKDNTHVIELNVESNDIYDPGLMAVADVIKTNKTLKIVKLQNQKKFPSHKAKDALLDALKCNPNIIRFSYDFMNIQQNDLLEKYLRRNQNSQRKRRSLMPPDRVPTKKQQEIMRRVSAARSETPVELALEEFSELDDEKTVFDLSNQPYFRRMTDVQRTEAMDRMKLIFTKNPFVQKVLLKNNGFGDDFAQYIADVIREDPSMIELDLESNEMSSTGLALIFEALKENTTLQVIQLRHQKKAPPRDLIDVALDCLKTNESLLKVGFDFQMRQKEIEKDRYLRRNADFHRKRRNKRKATIEAEEHERNAVDV